MFQTALPYNEPDVVTILKLTSFLLLLNLVGYVLDKLIYSGLIGQILIGVAWGVPGGKWLSISTQEVFVQLGYLGLILLVYEGGLSTNLQALRSNLFLSVLVALTGIGAPIGISFMLMGFVGANPLQAFAAGAALCSTSLGTTFTVLKTSGLTQSRLGVVLTSAAMLDDVVGLVMVQIISNLGVIDESFSVITVIRPIGVSVAFAVVVLLGCRFVVKPLAMKMGLSTPALFISKSQMAFLIHTAILIAFVVGSSYAGASNLFAAYLAGASISWYDSEIVNNGPLLKELTVAKLEHQELDQQKDTQVCQDATGHRVALSIASENIGNEIRPHAGKGVQNNPNLGLNAALENQNKPNRPRMGMSTWEVYYDTPVSTILKPLFFASIGFSIPVSKMFRGAVVWRGIVYSILMALAKLFCGLWLIRFSSNTTLVSGSDAQRKRWRVPKPKSLYPASILGCAMVARGEIGFLISAVAESRGIYSSTDDGSSELFLIVTWAIMLCTIVGPIGVGVLTKRVRSLQEIERDGKEGEDPLGVWGIK